MLIAKSFAEGLSGGIFSLLVYEKNEDIIRFRRKR